MRKVQVFHVDAFTSTPFGGNPAGVVPDASTLTDQEMQNIARELNLSETAFLLPSERNNQADFIVRFFTPTSEIDFCGHATIAAAWLLATTYRWLEKSDRIVFETNIGHVPVEWLKSDEHLKAVVMTQVAPQVKETSIDPDQIAELLGISASDLDLRYPIRLGYTGNWHLLVPVTTRSVIDAARPNLEGLGELNKQQKVVTTHLFTFESTEAEYDLYTRDFGPAVGLSEDPVTGAANGALAGYLILEGILDNNIMHELIIAQGDAVGRPGILYVTIIPTEQSPIIRVGGSAVPTISGTIMLPERPSKIE